MYFFIPTVSMEDIYKIFPFDQTSKLLKDIYCNKKFKQTMINKLYIIDSVSDITTSYKTFAENSLIIFHQVNYFFEDSHNLEVLFDYIKYKLPESSYIFLQMNSNNKKLLESTLAFCQSNQGIFPLISDLCIYDMLSLIISIYPENYHIFEAQYKLQINNRLMYTLQNRFHARARDLLNELNACFEKKVFLIEAEKVNEETTQNLFIADLSIEQNNIIRNLDNTLVYYSDSSRPDIGKCIIIPIYRFREIIEYLVIGGCETVPDDLMFSILPEAVTALTIEYEMRTSIFTVINKSRSGLLDAITGSGKLSLETISEWANLLGIKKGKLFSSIKVDFTLNNTNEHYGQDVYYDVLNFLVGYYHPDDYYFLRPNADSLYMVGQFPMQEKSEINQRIINFCNELYNILTKKYRTSNFYIGIGAIVDQIQDISKSYHDALSAIRIGKLIEKNIAIYDDFRLLKLLNEIGEGENVSIYIPQGLLKLKEFDKNNSTSLLNTLEEYYKANCNASLASKNLFIHYKTMLNRLDRIKTILKCDYNNLNVRLEFEIGLQIMNLRNSSDE